MTKEQLTFAIFILHQLSHAWRMSVPHVYSRLKETGVLDDYIISFYDVLHTQGQEYLVEDITELVKKREEKI